MLTNLSYLPEILNQYKNLTQKQNIHNTSYILGVDAMATTPFYNVKKDFKITGLISNDMNAEEMLLKFNIK